MKLKLALALVPLLLLAHGVNASEVSIWGAKVSAASSDEIPYAYDNNTGAVVSTDPGDGTSFGLGASTDFAGWNFGFGYASSKPTADTVYDTNPLATNDCNVNPVQGIYNDCFDHATAKIDTTVQTLDLTGGMSFAMGWGTVSPYIGIRQLTYDQTIDVGYIYPGGNESYPNRKIKLDGYGPRIGSRLNIPFGGSSFFFDGDLAIGKILSTSRDQNIVEQQNSGGSLAAINTAASKKDISPLTFDLSLMGGYKITSNFNVGLGVRYQKVTDVLDTRQTNPGGYAPGYGNETADLIMSSAFVKGSFVF